MMKRIIPMITSVAMLFPCIGTSSLSANANDNSIFTLSCDTKKICVDYSAEEENKNVFFTADCEDEVTGVELFDAATNEKIAVLYDDGNIDQNGDVYMNDGIYSNYFNMEDKPIEAYQFYAQYTDAQGEIHTSNTVKIDVYRLFTEQELADMSKVDDAISELTNSSKFKTMKTEEKVDAVMALLSSLEDEGLVHSIVLPENRLQIEFQYSTGVQGAISSTVFIDYDEPYDGEEIYTVTLKLNGYSRNAEFFLDEENREVTFAATCIKYHGNNVELVDAKTGEAVAVMLDDGDFENSGDDLDNDGTWCTKLNFDDMNAGKYSYYARITDENGNIYKTKTLSVVIFDTTTADMMKDAEANQKIADLQSSDEFKSASIEERKNMAERVLNSLVDEGYINEVSIEYLQDGLFTWVFTATAVQGYFDFSIHNHEDEGETTTSSSSTATITTTTTTVSGAESSGSDITTVSTETTSSITTVTTTLPQTGYSNWYQALIAASMGMVGLGGTAILKSGVIRKKDNNE